MLFVFSLTLILLQDLEFNLFMYSVCVVFLSCRMADREAADDELNIPRAAMNKMIKELVPNIRVANDARELMLNCCTEFIHLISSEANVMCNKKNKKTISPEHVLLGKFNHNFFPPNSSKMENSDWS